MNRTEYASNTWTKPSDWICPSCGKTKEQYIYLSYLVVLKDYGIKPENKWNEEDFNWAKGLLCMPCHSYQVS